jgi:hypothetical protein
VSKVRPNRVLSAALGSTVHIAIHSLTIHGLEALPGQDIGKFFLEEDCYPSFEVLYTLTQMECNYVESWGS